jgi:hypothetical protein
VDGGNGEVDDQLDVGRTQHVFAADPFGDAVLAGLGLCTCGGPVAEDDHAHVGEAGQVLEVCVADHSGADESDPTGPERVRVAYLSADPAGAAVSWVMIKSHFAMCELEDDALAVWTYDCPSL